MDRTFILIGGFYHLAFALFHMNFWKIFRWKASLRPITPANRSVMQVMNLCLIYIFLVVSAFSFLASGRLLASPAVAACISGFWLFRAVLQIAFFERKNPVSIILTALFLAGAALYGVPAIRQ
jgi:hypothetical protein